MSQGEARRTDTTARREPGSLPQMGSPRTLAADLGIIERHLRALEGHIARLKSNLAALGSEIASGDEPWSKGRLEAGELVVEHDARKVYVNGKAVPLSPTEYRGLHALVRNAGRVVTHRDLLRQATGSGFSEPSHLKVYIARLRAKLRGVGASEGLVENVRGVGYRLATGSASATGSPGPTEGGFTGRALPRAG